MMKKVLLLICAFLTSTVVLANEKSLYEFSWLDKDKEIYVLQNRRYRKVGTAYIGALGVKTISGAFIDSYGGSARAGYFFSEDWGIEGVFGKSSGHTNDTAKGVESSGSTGFYRKIDNYTGAMLMWSPFYSKINTFNQVFYYDWMFGLGVASIKTLDNRLELPTVKSSTLTSSSMMGVLWNAGLRVYINDNWSIRIDFTGLHAKPKSGNVNAASGSISTSNLFSNYDLGVGLNYAF